MKHIILMPTYNEAENIEKIISVILSTYQNVYLKVIDDNSPDGTGKIVANMLSQNPRLSLLSRSSKTGLGSAYIEGIKVVIKDSTVTHIITMDADLSHDPAYLAQMMEQSKYFDVVIGSRYITGGRTVGWEMWRRTLSFFGNLYARLITRTPIHDMTAGFICISIDLLKTIDLEKVGASGYAFLMELKYALCQKHAKIKEIPIVFVNRLGGESKISNHIISEGILAPWKMILKK